MFKLSMAKAWYGFTGYDLFLENTNRFPTEISGIEDLKLEVIEPIIGKHCGGHQPRNGRLKEYPELHIPELNKTFPARIGYSADGITVTWVKE